MVSNIINAYDESGYTGDYEYVYDPEHENTPSGTGWYLTEKGWARGSRQEEGHIPSKVIENPSRMGKPSPELLEHVKRAAGTIDDVSKYVRFGVIDNFKASQEVTKKLGNHRDNIKEFDDLIVEFASENYELQSPNKLSAISGYLFGLSPDFRNKGKPLPKYNQKALEKVKQYISNEQEIIRMTGLVNEDDTITLYRTTDEKQFFDKKLERGEKVPYKGNNLESWTMNPDFAFGPQTKVTARVPLSACIASCIGRKDRPFDFKEECEIMVCGAFVREVTCVKEFRGMHSPDFLENHYKEVRENMQRFARQGETKQAALNERRRIAKELILLAKVIMKEAK